MLTCGVTLGCDEVLLRLLAIGLANGAVIALNAISVTLVYSVVRMINFAHGDLFALMTVFAAWGINGLGLTPERGALVLLGGVVLVLVILGAVGAGLGSVVERIAFRPFRPGSPVAPLAATIGLSFILYQVALLLRYLTNAYIPGEHRSVPGIPEVPRIRTPELLPDFDLLSGLGMRATFPIRDLFLPLFAALVAGLVGWFLANTRQGRALRACAQDPETARLCGVNPDSTIRTAFMLGGALAGLAALTHILYYTHPYTLYGAQSGLIAFTAAVLGGIGRPWGALLAGLLLGILAAFSDFFLATQWTPILLLTILIVLLLVRPTGLAAGEQEEAAIGASGLGRGATARGDLLLWSLLAAAAIFPLFDRAGDLRLLVVASGIMVFVLLSIGLNLIVGFSGLLDLGYAACFAIGAYTAGSLTNLGGLLRPDMATSPDFLLVLALSVGAAGLFGLLNAALTMRLRGEYLAIVTLAFGQMVPQLFLNLDDWTGGMRGLSALPPPSLFAHKLSTPIERYYLALGLVALASLVCLRLARSRIGRAWTALSIDELAAMSSGVDRGYARLTAFALGAGMAGAAGALFAASFSFVNPTQSEFRVSAMILAMVVIGGAGSVPGAVIGALAVAGYDQVLIPLLGAWLQQVAENPELSWVSVLDPRGLNFLSFGLALYLTVLLRQRRRAPQAAEADELQPSMA